MSERLFELISEEDLERLQELAIEEHENFFKRNPHLKEAYHNSLMGIALCQGAALHYINHITGINDFDIWLFYKEDPKTKFWCRHRKSIENGYKGRRIDFLRRAIKRDLCDRNFDDSEKCIMEYLLKRDTETKRLLLKKAIVSLFPDRIFGKVMWSGR